MKSTFRYQALSVLAVFIALFAISCGQDQEQAGAPAPHADEAPAIGPVTPASGSGRTQAFRLEVSHPGGAASISDVQVLINEKLTASGAGSCWLDVNGTKTVAARMDDGSTFLPAVKLGAAGTAANKACTVDAAAVKVEANGNALAVTIPINFQAAFRGQKKIYVIASGPQKHSGWQERGAWTVQ